MDTYLTPDPATDRPTGATATGISTPATYKIASDDPHAHTRNVTQAISDLHTAVDNVETRFGYLYDRIHEILDTKTVVETALTPGPENHPVELVNILRALHDRLTRLAGHIEDTTTRTRL